MIRKAAAGIFLAGIIAGCAHQAERSAPDGDAMAAASERLNETVEAYFDETLELNPLFATFIGDNRFNDRLANNIGEEWRDRNEALERRYLAQINRINPELLEGQDRLTYEIFKYNREQTLEGLRYPSYLIPVNQMFSFPNFMAQLGSGQSAQPFSSIKDYENWLSRLDDFAVWMDQAVVNFRQGMRQGVVHPKVVIEKVLPQLAAHAVDDVEESIFYMPVKNIPDMFEEVDRKKIIKAYRTAIRNTVVPSYKKLHDFLKDEYLPNARDSVGYSGHPNGVDWYNYMIKTNTTTSMTANEIHEIGLKEVARIRGEMEKVMETVGFEGTLAEWFEYVKTDDKFYFDNEEDLLEGYRALEAKMNAEVGKLFSVSPKAGFEVRAVEAFRAASSAGASYQRPSPDGSRPGIFYVNTYNLKAQPKFGLETLFIHEAIPGHHFETALSQEIASLPRFRRFGGYTVYSEGWALYAESIGKELGFFTDPMQWYGRLADEQLRAMRLVVDTGLHAKGWTREQAMQFMLDNSSMAESDVVAEVERYIAIPGQALSYKVGQLTIQRLRDKAERELRGDFDIREFHSAVLLDGPLPMPVLEANLNRWIDGNR
ncbi:MAG: DUF885 domain-containing protein [Gammaproteobacteria bacterium]|nr:DUF885 domain-containing protein [Gammaproteobacteria bacterium]